MKKVSIFICSIILIISCNKSDFLSTINFEKFLLSGSGNYHNTEHTWYLDSLVVDGVPYQLSSKQKTYNRTYLNNGTFTDSDGYSGKWDIKKQDELTVFFKNNFTGTYIESKWKIIDITSTKFIYNITGADSTKYDYYFKISYN
jgi:hypothetical protein